MKKFALLILLFAGSFSTLKAEESPSAYASDTYAYATLGGITPLLMFPIAGIGTRIQSGHNGFDIGVQGTCFGNFFILKANATYLFYPKPNLQKQFYYGIGAGIERMEKEKTSFSPEFVVGKQFTNDTGGRRFFEAQITPYIVDNHGHGTLIPGVIIRYGIGF